MIGFLSCRKRILVIAAKMYPSWEKFLPNASMSNMATDLNFATHRTARKSEAERPRAVLNSIQFQEFNSADEVKKSWGCASRFDPRSANLGDIQAVITRFQFVRTRDTDRGFNECTHK